VCLRVESAEPQGALSPPPAPAAAPPPPAPASMLPPWQLAAESVLHHSHHPPRPYPPHHPPDRQVGHVHHRGHRLFEHVHCQLLVGAEAGARLRRRGRKREERLQDEGRRGRVVAGGAGGDADRGQQRGEADRAGSERGGGPGGQRAQRGRL